MRLLRLYIIHSGVFQKNVIDFTDKTGKPQELICLAGVNGSGKTTILELILNLMLFLNPKLSLHDIFIDRLKPNVLTRTEFAQLDILIEGKILSLVLGDSANILRAAEYEQTFIIENEIASILKDFEDAVKFKNKELGNSMINRYEYLEKKFSNRKSSQVNAELFKDLFQHLESSIGFHFDKTNQLPFIYYFNAEDREIQDLRYSSIPEYKPIYEIVQKYHPQDDDLKKLLVYYDYAYNQEFEKIISWLNANVLIDKTIDKIYRPAFKVIIKTERGEHGLELLSSGEESILIMALQLYLSASENTVILIDEIDQSLHPQYQERIMLLIQNIQEETNCQIIVSSHSEFIWKEFEENSILDLTRR